ncbi:hypothetical protein SALBM311S_08022 [Streptomyces alboniger]
MAAASTCPSSTPPPAPLASPLWCSQKTVTVPPEAGANLWQPLQYGSEAWQRVYFRLRNSVEGINGYAKDPLYERLEDAGTRRIRGIAAKPPSAGLPTGPRQPPQTHRLGGLHRPPR